MIFALRSKVLAIFILCLCINLTIAERWPIHLHRRDGPTTPSITDSSSNPSSSPTESGASKETGKGSESSTAKPAKTSASVTSGSKSASSSTSKSASPTISISAVTSNINGAAPTSSFNNNSSFNSTLTPNKLPLTPEITPAFAVAGVILMISGVAYTLVGIRNQWLHIFLSAAYLASLSVTVLILYVMNPPVSNAIQGAYLVAIVMTGLILGGAAIVFKEMTEGLGCLLGGFCFSMWLLVLKPGGLVTSTGGISGFIAAFSLAAFATSFSHVTRPYGLIGGISFAGATAVVLGIDCVSRAGLKEFWVYLWKLNDNLFPLGATTYPLTRGLRVEIAAIVVICLAGIVSQMKLWKIVKERRAQRSAERLQDERTMEQEEENVGRRIEQQNTQSRNQWETVYGDKDAITSADHSNRDSGVGDMESKKGAMSTVTSLRRSAEEEIEMAEMSPTLTTGAGLVMTNKGQEGGPVTIRVARDVQVPQILDENGNHVEPTLTRLSHVSVNSSSQQLQEPEEGVWVMGADGEARMERRSSKQSSKRVSGPNVVPLPFKVPEGDVEDDRSSVATFADDEQAGHKRLSHRLSTGSALFRKLSHRSQRNSKRYSMGEGRSTEDLVIPHEIEDDRASSVAATVDGLSDDEDMRSVRSSIRNSQAFGDDKRASASLDKPEMDSQPKLDTKHEDEPAGSAAKRPISALTVATEILEPVAPNEDKVDEPTVQKSLTSSTDPKPEPETSEADIPQAEKAAPSVKSTVESKSASITKERLPAQLSKVVMSYRTNEWAKHLSGAEAPDLEDLKLEEYPAGEESLSDEAAAPLNMEELQQTPESTIRPPSRSISRMSDRSVVPLARSSSALSKMHPSSRPETSSSQPSLRPSLSNLNTRGLLSRNSSTPNIPQPIVESPIEDIPGANQFSSQGVPFGSSSTLMGKRDSILRQKSFVASPSSLPPTPELTSGQFQSTTSSTEPSIHNNQMDDNMSLSARRDLIRKASLQSVSNSMTPLQQTPIPFDSHQPRRLSSAPHPQAREQQLASWRASVQQGFQSAAQPATIERQRSALWQDRQAEEQKKAVDARRRKERDSAFDQRMRRGDMLDAHREALRKMQASANKHA